jgi:hypothetical protein
MLATIATAMSQKTPAQKDCRKNNRLAGPMLHELAVCTRQSGNLAGNPRQWCG